VPEPHRTGDRAQIDVPVLREQRNRVIDPTRQPAIAIAFTESEHAEPEEWRNAVLNNADLWLTAEEFQRVAQALGAVLEPYRGRARRSERPAASRRVRVMNVVVPHPRRR
jgi:hypothetical protein